LLAFFIPKSLKIFLLLKFSIWGRCLQGFGWEARRHETTGKT
jgi:hypothetical protein